MFLDTTIFRLVIIESLLSFLSSRKIFFFSQVNYKNLHVEVEEEEETGFHSIPYEPMIDKTGSSLLLLPPVTSGSELERKKTRYRVQAESIDVGRSGFIDLKRFS